MKTKEYRSFAYVHGEKIESLGAELFEIKHIKTGVSILYVKRDDRENVFAIAFKTPPVSSNGAPHILEHTVLCGSKKFPVKDAFFSMTRRSLSSYMNALTGSDYTAYPAGTCSRKDFYNLLDIYTDAVFAPNLRYESFQQEGHRFEFEKADDPESALTFKGVVYNEMKGVFGSSDTRLYYKMMKELTPNCSYRFVSGGDPQEIPSLSHDELRLFHKTYYDPTSALFYFYGNLPIEEHLDFLEEKVFKNLEPKTNPTSIEKQERFKEPKHFEGKFPTEEKEKLDEKVLFGLSWLTCDAKDLETVILLDLLDSLLMDTDASPLQRAILSSKLCHSVSSFMDADKAEVPFIMILEGVKDATKDAIEPFILKTLKEIADKGFEEERIEAALHQIELERREITGSEGPFGLSIFFKLLPSKFHGRPLSSELLIDQLFVQIRNKLKDKNVLSNLMRLYLIDNPHRVSVAFTPDPHLGKEEKQREEKRLAEIKAKLSFEEKRKIILDTQKLKEYQNRDESEEVKALPTVTLNDAPKLPLHFTLEKKETTATTLYTHTAPTNGLFYLHLIYDLPIIEEKDLLAFKLMTQLIGQLGAGSDSFEETLQKIEGSVGSMGSFIALHPQVDKTDTFRPALTFYMKGLNRKSAEALSLFKDVVHKTRFDEKERIKELIAQIHTSQRENLSAHGLKYARLLATESFSKAGHLRDLWEGVSYYRGLKELFEHLDERIDSLMEDFERLKRTVFCKGQPEILLTSDEEGLKSFPFNEEDFKGEKNAVWDLSFPKKEAKSYALSLPGGVANNFKALPSIGYIDTDAAALLVAAELMENLYIHTEVREKGGAYTAKASYNPQLFYFGFYSARDPEITESFAAFDRAVQQIAAGKFSDEDLTSAKLGILQRHDAPIAPGQRGYIAYTRLREGLSQDLRESFRKKLFSLSKEEVAKATVIHLLPKIGDGVSISLASKEIIEKKRGTLPLLGSL